jgi:hypothetical protein
MLGEDIMKPVEAQPPAAVEQPSSTIKSADRPKPSFWAKIKRFAPPVGLGLLLGYFYGKRK